MLLAKGLAVILTQANDASASCILSIGLAQIGYQVPCLFRRRNPVFEAVFTLVESTGSALIASAKVALAESLKERN